MNLSKSQTFLLNLLKNLGCMSYIQISDILKRTFNISDGQITVILKDLQSRNVVTITPDNNYILLGGKNSNNKNSINRDLIECLYYVLDNLEDYSEIAFAYIPSNGITLTYTTNNHIYNLMYCSTYSITQILIVQNLYLEKTALLQKEMKSKTIPSFETLIFIFGSEEDPDFVLNKMSELNITVPHKIVLLKSDDLRAKPEYDIYDMTE